MGLRGFLTLFQEYLVRLNSGFEKVRFEPFEIAGDLEWVVLVTRASQESVWSNFRSGLKLHWRSFSLSLASNIPAWYYQDGIKCLLCVKRAQILHMKHLIEMIADRDFRSGHQTLVLWRSGKKSFLEVTTCDSQGLFHMNFSQIAYIECSLVKKLFIRLIDQESRYIAFQRPRFSVIQPWK